MKAVNRNVLMKSFKIFDLVVMVGAFVVATLIAYLDLDTQSLREFLTARTEVHNFALFLGVLFLWHAIFSFSGLYFSRRLSSGLDDEVGEVIRATLLGTVSISLVGLMFRIEIITPSFLVTFWTTVSLLTILGRVIVRHGLRRVRRLGRNLNHLLIVGTNQRAVALADKINAKKELGYHLVGFVDNAGAEKDEFRKRGWTTVCDFDGFGLFLKDHVVDEVMICVPVKSFYEESSRIVAQCEEQGITVRFVPDIFAPVMGAQHIDYLDDQIVVSVHTVKMRTDALLFKRLLDFGGSLTLLVALAPILLAISILIKINSPGPVLFSQERVGLNKRRFRLYKFRTMVPDAEKRLKELEHLNEASGPVFKIKKDPRITPIGEFLRKSSLDELPQLINVLKGDMSLVGPRPLPERDYNGFEQDGHRRRFSVRPGLTCLWQIEGRSSIPFERWMELDMQYIDQWSIWLDIKILARTIPAVLKGAGAV